MPTYDYLCNNCRVRFEKFQGITAKPLKKCPECGKMALNRLIGTGAGVIFKGSGFYETDYRSDSYKAGQKSDKSDSSADTAKKKETEPDSSKKETEPAKSEAPKSDPAEKPKKKA